jgi:Cu-processing system ATP-binding protein
MIEIRNLHKRFGKLEVLKGIDLSLFPGRTTAILGPNGSGKTTLIKSVLGLVRPDSGDIRYLNVSILNDWRHRREMGYLPQIARFPENLTVQELIRFIEDLRGHQGQYKRLVGEFELEKSMNKKLRNLSGGTRQKVNLVLTFMFDPSMYILDEPTSGLDPVAMARFRELISNTVNRSKTVIFTTHIMNLVEEIADDLVFLLEGKVYFQGTCRELLESQQEINLESAIAKILTKEKYAENIEV